VIESPAVDVKEVHKSSVSSPMRQRTVSAGPNHRLRERNERAVEFNMRRDQLGVERVWETRVEHVDGSRVRVA